ncbi:MAG: TonB family protein [Opitutales bacterium]|nr:TonB family protein [Opitutales bacterium]
MKKTTDDAERLSSLGAVAVCTLLFAGTLALVAEKSAEAENEAAETAQYVPARIAVCFQNYVPPPVIEEIETAPEDPPVEAEFSLPKLSEPTPEVSQKPEPAPEAAFEKIDESALRETFTEEAPKAETLPEKAIEKPSPEPEKPEKKIPPEPQPQTKRTCEPPPESVPAVDEAARIAAEQTIYGVLAEAVSRKKFYPKAARRNGRTGTVFLRVSIGICGKIKSIETEKSGAHRSLVSGAEETLRRVAADFCVPAELRAVLPAAFVVPVVYELKESP